MKIKLPQLKKPTKRQVKDFLIYVLIVVVGNALTAAGSCFFIKANGFALGGTTGIGIFIEKMLAAYNVTGAWTEWVVTITIYVANFILFVVGAFFLGKKFAFAAAAGTVLYPSFFALFEIINKAYVGKYGHYIGMDPNNGGYLLAAICGALLFGLGIGMVVRVGASTGGTDIPPLILKKLFDWPVSITMWLLDFSIVAIELFVPNISVEEVLYGVLITLIASLVISKVSPLGLKRTQVKIVSQKYKEIREYIINKLSRGVTVLYGQTGYLKESCHLLLTVVSSREVAKIKTEVHRIDPHAFITFSVVSEVRGRGFSADKVDEESANWREVTEEEPELKAEN